VRHRNDLPGDVDVVGVVGDGLAVFFSEPSIITDENPSFIADGTPRATGRDPGASQSDIGVALDGCRSGGGGTFLHICARLPTLA
jgi:hypothetical protein